MVNHSIKTGVSFGLTSGVITTLGLMVGLNSGTHSKLAVLGGILTIAIADAFSDALGIHVAEEAENIHTPSEIWQATFATLITKFLFAMTFAVPVFLFALPTAIVVNIAYGLAVLSLMSWFLARQQGDAPIKCIAEHVAIALLVIAVTHFVGQWVGRHFT